MRGFSIGLAAAAIAGVAHAQTTPPAETLQGAAQAPAVTATAGEDWNAISRSATRIFLVDVNAISVADGITTVKLARVPVTPAASTDKSYILAELQYRCAAKESRELSSTQIDETGTAGERFDSG